MIIVPFRDVFLLDFNILEIENPFLFYSVIFLYNVTCYERKNKQYQYQLIDFRKKKTSQFLRRFENTQ